MDGPAADHRFNRLRSPLRPLLRSPDSEEDFRRDEHRDDSHEKGNGGDRDMAEGILARTQQLSPLGRVQWAYSRPWKSVQVQQHMKPRSRVLYVSRQCSAYYSRVMANGPAT